MVFTADIGNTVIAIAGITDGKTQFSFRLASDLRKTSDQYAAEISAVMKLHGYDVSCIDGSAVSSVVPPLIPVFKAACELLFGCRTVIVGPGVKTGLNIKIDDPAMLGADLVCGAVAALKKYPMPCIIFNLGTAVTISVLDKNGCFLGGSIFPGIRVSLNALSDAAAQLPRINTEIRGTVKTICSNSVDSMKSGIILGTASMIDGMTVRCRESLGKDGASASVVITGEMADIIAPHCRENVNVDPALLSTGLYSIYMKNR